MKPKGLPVVKSAIRAIDLLEFVAGAEHPPSFAQIGAELEIPNSSLFYLLNSLRARGYLRQTATRGGYSLGPALLSLSQSVGAGASWLPLASSLIDSVWDVLRETTS